MKNKMLYVFALLFLYSGLANRVLGKGGGNPLLALDYLSSIQIVVSGQVFSDEDGSPLPGVNIVEKGTTNGVVTDFDGKFSINVNDGNAVLVVSYIGHATLEVPISGRTSLTITLEESATGLEEVIVLGYGSAKKSDLTGSVGQVSGAELTKSSGAVLQQALQGKVAGAQITQTSGSPGADLRVRIRGSNSVYYGNDPLYVIDGVPVSDGSLSYINPNDVESISVLKDASATAIYGARGANGVVMVTTKKGRAGATEVSIDYYSGVQNVAKKLEVLNAQEWATTARLFWTRFRDGGLLSRAYSEEEIANMGEGTNWQDEIYRTAPIQNYDISVRGGNDKTKFFVSGNYYDQQGIAINSRFQKGTLRVNLDHAINDKFSIGLHLTPSYIVNKPIDSDIIYQGIIQNPVLPVRNEDGSYSSQAEIWRTTGIYMSPEHQNPVQMAYERKNVVERSRLLSDLSITYNILEGLTYKSTFGLYLDNRTGSSFTPSYFESEITRGSNGSASRNQTNKFNWLHESVLNYTKDINDHHFDATAGFTAQSDRDDYFSATTWEFANNSTGYYNLGAGNDPQNPSSYRNRSSLTSVLGRVNYSFDQKYLVTVSGRYDGSSRFGGNNQFGFFPSAALAWRINKESFLEDVEVISNMKLRLSAGRTGNQSIPLYQNVQTFGIGSPVIFGNTEYTSIVPGSLVNNDLRWEKTDQFDLGLDLGFFGWGSNFDFTVDYYYKKTTDLLLNVQIPRQGGYSSLLKNIGSVENQGLELTTGLGLNFGDVIWNLNGNVSFNRNKVLQLSGSDKYFGSSINQRRVGVIGKNGGAASVVMEGQPLGVFWGNIFDGLWQTQEEYDNGHMANDSNSGPGFENWRDIDGNGVFEEGIDETVIGDPNPDYTFSLSSDLMYRNFDFSFSFYGTHGNDILNAYKIEGLSQVNNQNVIALLKEAWDGPGTGNLIPKIDRPAGRSGTYPNRAATNYIEDGSFIRLQNVTLGYTFKNLNFLDTARLYISGENLFVVTGYSGYDPEVNSRGNDNTVLGVDDGVYPKSRTIRIGAQLKF